MHASLTAAAERMRDDLAAGRVDPTAFDAALQRIPYIERDAWVDAVFGLHELPEDGPALPRGCVPYLPSDVDTLRRMVRAAAITADDVFVDIGAGVGRAMALVRCLTGARAVGIEVQPALAREARDLVARLRMPGVDVIEGDVATLDPRVAVGSVFFLYCPFGGARLQGWLDGLEPVARTREIRVCTVDLPLPAAPWLTEVWRDDRLLVLRGPA